MVIARGLPDGPVPPKTQQNDFDRKLSKSDNTNNVPDYRDELKQEAKQRVGGAARRLRGPGRRGLALAL
eukprot:8529835-Heterocapsa_arctica.AAC.1